MLRLDAGPTRCAQVEGGEVTRGERAVFFDATGNNVTITAADVNAAGVHAGGSDAAGAGRRLQAFYAPESVLPKVIVAPPRRSG